MPSPSEIRSNILSYYIGPQTTGGQLLTNGLSGAVFVVTFLQLVNMSGSSNDAALIQTVHAGVTVHSGYVGAGSYDRFPLVCELAIVESDGLTLVVEGGSWCAAASGYFTPEVARGSA